MRAEAARRNPYRGNHPIRHSFQALMPGNRLGENRLIRSQQLVQPTLEFPISAGASAASEMPCLTDRALVRAQADVLRAAQRNHSRFPSRVLDLTCAAITSFWHGSSVQPLHRLPPPSVDMAAPASQLPFCLGIGAYLRESHPIGLGAALCVGFACLLVGGLGGLHVCVPCFRASLSQLVSRTF